MLLLTCVAELREVPEVLSASLRDSDVGYMRGGSGARNEMPGVTGLSGSERSIMP
jgi:hypothetical protein